jgi:phosphohistidine phosphatase SixA
MSAGEVMGTIRHLGLCVALCAGLSAAATHAQPDSHSERTQAVLHTLKALRAGGHVLVMTHGAVEADERDEPGVRPDDCARQQGLSDLGRLAASGTGTLLARLDVPVGAIVSSRYCRALESAQRIADATRTKNTSTLNALNDAHAAPPAVAQARAMALRRLVSTAPRGRSNTLLLTHKANLSRTFELDGTPPADGELWVFKPAAQGHERIARIQLVELSAAMRHLNSRSAP